MTDVKICDHDDSQCNEDTGVSPEQIYLDMLAMAA